jgi:hypothetical protein
MAKIPDLIAKCDDSEIFTQMLEENTLEMKVIGKNGRITFLTDPQIITDKFLNKPSKIGIVIWFPADVFER